MQIKPTEHKIMTFIPDGKDNAALSNRTHETGGLKLNFSPRDLELESCRLSSVFYNAKHIEKLAGET